MARDKVTSTYWEELSEKGLLCRFTSCSVKSILAFFYRVSCLNAQPQGPVHVDLQSFHTISEEDVGWVMWASVEGMEPGHSDKTFQRLGFGHSNE